MLLNESGENKATTTITPINITSFQCKKAQFISRANRKGGRDCILESDDRTKTRLVANPKVADKKPADEKAAPVMHSVKERQKPEKCFPIAGDIANIRADFQGILFR